MIVCSCNVISDRDVREAVRGSQSALRHAKQIYGCLGRSAECGRCARTIKSIIDEAWSAVAGVRPTGCCAALANDGLPDEMDEDFDLAAS